MVDSTTNTGSVITESEAVENMTDAAADVQDDALSGMDALDFSSTMQMAKMQAQIQKTMNDINAFVNANYAINSEIGKIIGKIGQ
ncbi:MAG: hypothetical protein GY935_02150 [Gammaproteobacteria bacterium]|nr:hypothetical protein [Gammaproteobacteria bacterium]